MCCPTCGLADRFGLKVAGPRNQRELLVTLCASPSSLIDKCSQSNQRPSRSYLQSTSVLAVYCLFMQINDKKSYHSSQTCRPKWLISLNNCISSAFGIHAEYIVAKQDQVRFCCFPVAVAKELPMFVPCIALVTLQYIQLSGYHCAWPSTRSHARYTCVCIIQVRCNLLAYIRVETSRWYL
ncbi:hypothetical protein VTK56DRAFT_6233 [Thermocarpiscus australiensis]